MKKVTAILICSLLCAQTVLGEFCPRMSDLNILNSTREYVAAYRWYEEGNTDPKLACNGGPYSVGSDAIITGYSFTLGSLYVMPGCTFTSYTEPNFEGDGFKYTGPYEGYSIAETPRMYSFTSSCIQRKPQCTPTETIEIIRICDNSKGVSDMECEYQQQIGSVYSTSISESMNVSAAVATSIEEEIFNLFSSITSPDYSWKETDTSTFSKLETFSATESVPEGIKLTIQQVVGYCADESSGERSTSRVNDFTSIETRRAGTRPGVRYFKSGNVPTAPMSKVYITHPHEGSDYDYFYQLPPSRNREGKK